MAQTLQLQQLSRRTPDQAQTTFGAIVRAVAADHALALRATATAASPRRGLTELRAMYLPPLDLY